MKGSFRLFKVAWHEEVNLACVEAEGTVAVSGRTSIFHPFSLALRILTRS